MRRNKSVARLEALAVGFFVRDTPEYEKLF